MTADSTVTSLVPGKSDAQIAEEIRSELRPHLELVCDILNRSRRVGMMTSWNLGPNQYGQFAVIEIAIVKPI